MKKQGSGTQKVVLKTPSNVLLISDLHIHSWWTSSLCKMLNCVPLDEFDGFKCFVHVSYSEVEAEVQHGVSGLFLAAL